MICLEASQNLFTMVQFKKTLIAILILTASVASAQAQKNVYKSVGVSYTVGAPNWTPTAKQNTEIARDSVTGTWYIWSLDSATWHATQFIEFVDAAPTYTPGKGQPLVAIDSSGIIYRYRAEGMECRIRRRRRRPYQWRQD